MSVWSRLLGADRAAWREHERRAGELVSEKDLLADGYPADASLRLWRQRLAEEPPERLGSALMLVVRLVSTSSQQAWYLREHVAVLLRKRFEVSDDDALLATRAAMGIRSSWNLFVALRIAEVMLCQRFGPTITDATALEVTRQLIDKVTRRSDLGAEGNTLRSRLQKLLPVETGGLLDTAMILEVDGWSADVVPRLTDGSVDVAAAAGLLRQLASATGSKPTKSWGAETARLVADPATRAVLRLLVERLPEAAPVPSNAFTEHHTVALLLDERNGDLVRAAIWATVSVDEPWVVPTLLAIGSRAFARRAGYIASPKVANAAIFVLGRIGGAEAVAALSTLDAKASDNGYRKRIAAAVEVAGAAEGLTPGQVLERMADTGGLDRDGTKELVRDTVTAVATLGDDLTITLTWGGLAKPPASATDSDVNSIKREVRDLRAVVAKERRRIEGLFAEDRAWDLAEWRRYYLDHPITARIAARLLWRFGGDTRLGSDDLPSGGEVRLWHPARSTTDEVSDWRDRLLEEGLRQPFKQAYREIYLLTDAERETRVYSNRFAAHVLRYGQTYALVKERGWVANYLGPYDGGFEGKARREFRDAAITAVFEHFPVETDRLQGAPELCTTDRVWFHRGAGRSLEAIPLEEVPPLVFSEAMRDVDLFVGVASIALDPNWADQDSDPHYGYWQRVSFGDLTERAQVRRDVLARILPKLAVASRVTLGERFVRVRGKLGAYKIHLGSANIMIEPDDRYLCIVPNRAKGSRVMLPFDGDEVLSVILSKIVLLAADDKIKDPTILSQLKR